MTQQIILLLLVLISISSEIRSNDVKVFRENVKVENEWRNSPALNNFLKEVLSAKNELKWIDRMIYPRVNDHKYPETRRRLLATRNVRSVKRKNFWSYGGNSVDGDDDEDDDYQDYFDDADMLTDSKTSFHTGIKKKRRSNLDDDALEYDDYNSNQEKCEPVAHGGVPIKKMNNETKYVEPKTVFLTPKNLDPEKLTFKKDNLQVRDDLQNYDDSDNDYEVDYDGLKYGGVDNDDQFNGREARNHRDQDHEAQLALEESKLGDDNQKYKRTFEADDIFNYLDGIPFDLSPPEVGNTSSSGSDYHALKATDDMFKGGIEQGDSVDEKIDNFKKISQTKSGNTYPPYLEKNKWYNLKLIQRNGEKTAGKVKTSVDKKVKTKQESREKRLTVNDMPVMHHESIVEPSNWPWEYYDDKDDMRIKFGRGLMQVSNEKFSGSVKRRKKMSSRNSFKNFKFINSTNLSYSPKKSNFRLEHNRLKKRFNGVSFPYEKKPVYNKKFQLRRFAREAENKNEDKDDASQIHFRVNGILADELVDKIFQKIDESEYLKESLTFQRGNKSDATVFKQADNATVVEEDKTVEMMKTIRGLLRDIIKNELDKKLCMKLPRCLEKFLVWMVETEDAAGGKTAEKSDSEKDKTEQKRVLFPSVSKSPSSENPPESSTKKNLSERSRLIVKSAENTKNEPTNFSKPSEEEDALKIDSLFGQLHEKMKLLKRLLKAYHLLNFQEKRKVKAVHDYLRKQLKALEKFEELKNTIPNFPTLPPINKMSNKLINTDRNNSLQTSYDNDNSLLSLFSNELTHRNKLRDLEEKEVEKIKKVKKKKIESSSKDNFRKKRDMVPSHHFKIIKKFRLPPSTTAPNDLSSKLIKFSSSICSLKEIDKKDEIFSNESTEILAYLGDEMKIEYNGNEYGSTRSFPLSSSTLVPSAAAFNNSPAVKRNRLMINNKNNQIKMTSIAPKSLMKINEIMLQLNSSNAPTTPKNSLATLESAKLLESKINIFPVDP